MKCSKCGEEFEGKFCPNCGEKVPYKLAGIERFCVWLVSIGLMITGVMLIKEGSLPSFLSSAALIISGGLICPATLDDVGTSKKNVCLFGAAGCVAVSLFFFVVSSVDLNGGSLLEYQDDFVMDSSDAAEEVSDVTEETPYVVENVGEEETVATSNEGDAWMKTIKGETISVDIDRIYLEEDSIWGQVRVCIVCNFTNISGNEIYPSKMDLNNNGVITHGFCENYGGIQLAPGASVSDTVKFSYPETSNRSFDNMTLTVDGTTVRLSDKSN